MAAGRYPMKAVGELDRDVLSGTMARLSATVSCPDVRLRKSAPPVNVLGITVHGLYNPRNASGLQQRASPGTKCSATLNAPAAIDPVSGNRNRGVLKSAVSFTKIVCFPI